MFYPEKVEEKGLSSNEKGKNDNRLFSAIDDSNTSDNNFGAGDTNSVENDYVQKDENALTLEEYNKLFNNARSNLEKISSNESKMNKDTASISGIKIGTSIDEVHRILEDEHYEVEGYVINDEGGQNAYYLLNSYIDGYSEEDYSRRTILYFDDDVCMEYYIYDGVVCEISLFIAEDMPEY